MNISETVEALNYARMFSGKIVVVKLGGELLEGSSVKLIAQDLAVLKSLKIDVVVVHGGGKKLSSFMEKIGKKPEFVGGKRVTDAETLELAEMVFVGNTKSKLLQELIALHEKPVGLSGRDAGFIKAKKAQGLGLVGDVESVDCELLNLLLSKGFLPVVSSLGYSSEGGLLNLNADDLAVAIASAIGAEKLVILTNVDGVLDSKKNLLSVLSEKQAEELIATKVIEGGMIPKVRAGVAAINAGVKRVHVINGEKPHALLAELFSEKGIGTMIVK